VTKSKEREDPERKDAAAWKNSEKIHLKLSPPRKEGALLTPEERGESKQETNTNRAHFPLGPWIASLSIARRKREKKGTTLFEVEKSVEKGGEEEVSVSMAREGDHVLSGHYIHRTWFIMAAKEKICQADGRRPGVSTVSRCGTTFGYEADGTENTGTRGKRERLSEEEDGERWEASPSETPLSTLPHLTSCRREGLNPASEKRKTDVPRKRVRDRIANASYLGLSVGKKKGEISDIRKRVRTGGRKNRLCSASRRTWPKEETIFVRGDLLVRGRTNAISVSRRGERKYSRGSSPK